MCGNGGRCSAYYYMTGRKGSQTSFEALGDLYTARFAGQNIALRMKDPVKLRSLRLEAPEGPIPLHFIDTGAPHAVIFTPELPDALRRQIGSGEILGLGRSIRSHREFQPDGTNVDFIELLSGGGISMRTYERGVEGETLACGTGAVASAVVSALFKGLAPPVHVKTRSNETLKVDFHIAGNQVREIDLEGPVRRVYKGELEYSPSAERGHHGI
jgi:diaminopimelate epimerase